MNEPQSVREIVVRRLQTVSPSLAEALRICPLRGLLSRSTGPNDYVLGNPKAWLGTAYHSVIERAASGSCGINSDDPIGSLWAIAIDRLYRDARTHPLNKRFGSPEHWPGYHVALAGVRLRVTEAYPGRRPRTAAPASTQPPVSSVREERFTACGGKLVGRPDLVEGDAIVDYKSGAVFDETAEGPSIKAGYARQLRIYGFLAHENLSQWPTRGVLLPMLGERAEIDLTPDACRDEAEAAVAMLDAVNARMGSASGPLNLASPAAAGCGGCPYRIICPGYWESVTHAWAGNGRYGDAEGIMQADATRVHGGVAYALHLTVERGSVAAGPNVISPLASSIHEDAGQCAAGTKVRITGLCVRHNGQLAPTLYTVVKRTADLPTISLGSS